MMRHVVRSVRSARPVRVTLAAGALASLLLWPSPARAQAPDAPLKIAVVNIDVIAVRSPAGRALSQRIMDLQTQFEAELQNRQSAVRELELRIGRADSLTTPEQRSLERQYQDALTDFQRYQQDVQEQAQAMRAAGMNDIRLEIGPVLEAIRTEQEIDLILSATNQAIVLTSERIDITQVVLDRLQAAPGD